MHVSGGVDPVKLQIRNNTHIRLILDPHRWILLLVYNRNFNLPRRSSYPNPIAITNTNSSITYYVQRHKCQLWNTNMIIAWERDYTHVRTEQGITIQNTTKIQYVLIYVLYTIHEMARFGIQGAIQYTQDTAPACGKYRGISVIRIGT